MQNEKRLIYADEARKAILREAPAFAYCLDRVKSVDAVEVVRCEVCKWYKTTSCAMHDENYPEWYPKYTDFCSYGERKDNER